MADLNEVVKELQNELIAKNVLPPFLVGKLGKLNISFLHFMVSNHDMTLDFVRQIGLLKKDMKCDKCGDGMTLYKGPNIDKQLWRCHRKTKVVDGETVRKKACECKKSVRHDSLFQASKMSIGEILILTYSLVKEKQRIDIHDEWGHANQTLVDWANFCREIYLFSLTRISSRIGGVGKVVEIDESKLGGRKCNSSHPIDQWLFVGIECGTESCFVASVEKRSAATLLEVITKWILPGTTVISNCWGSYKLDREDLELLQSNHSINITSKGSGSDTNSIEEMWRRVKAFLGSNGRVRDHFPGYLAEYLFRKRAEAEHKDIYEAFIEEVRLIYVL